jgi:glycosyltransferase involved in cell wall biosynthesis
MKPLVSIIIPCRNEEKYIGKCLDSILKQDYPKERIEVLVIDGMSEDRTRKIVEDYSPKFSLIEILENPNKFTPFGLNIGVKNAKGEIIIRIDAHATYLKDYISKCIEYLQKYNADNVGGVLMTKSGANTFFAKAIALALSYSFGAGDSYFRTGVKRPKWVDTVFGGCYKKEVFQKIGLFNENLVRSQDLEFNLRLKKAGGKILLVPNIVSYYYPKSNLKDFFIHNFEDGIWVIFPLKLVKIPFRLRHYIPFIFVLSLLGTGILGILLPVFLWLFLFILGLYFSVSIYFSIKISAKEKDVRFLFLLPVVFVTRHIGYGLGSIWGLMKLLF